MVYYNQTCSSVNPLVEYKNISKSWQKRYPLAENAEQKPDEI